MTRAGWAVLLAGALALGFGIGLGWLAFDVAGVGLLLLVAAAGAAVARPSTLVVTRTITPPRVPKGSPALAMLGVVNRGRRSAGVTVAHQPFGDSMIRTVIPRLHAGEQAVRSYRLPTDERGIYDVGPVLLDRTDPFALVRISRRQAGTERLWVYPRILPLRPLPTGLTRHLDGESADTSPQGSITFHRLREYVHGDDLRLVHWRSSARTGTLVVKHNVDTSQPYTVLLLDLRPAGYTAESFEAAVDLAASVVVASGHGKAPVQLRLTDGGVLGGPRLRETAPLLDHLTGVGADPAGSLAGQFLALRRAGGGTSLVVVTGVLDRADLPAVAQLRRRFEQVVLVSIDTGSIDTGSAPESGTGSGTDRSVARPPAHVPGLRMIVEPDADAAGAAWNLLARQ